MEIFYASQADEDRRYWQRHDRSVIERIDTLLADIQKHPFTGLGKPEPLKYHWSGFWSRRITGEHRLVYRVEMGVIFVAQCRYHYRK